MIRYLFVNSFKWKDTFNQMQFNGHPLEKQVYRSLYNNSTKIYSLIFTKIGEQHQALPLEVLEADNEGCTYKVTELARTNILDHEIDETELDKIINWMDTDNNDLTPRQQQLPVPLQNLMNESFRQAQQDEEFLKKVYVAFEELNLHNTIYAEILLKLAEQLREYSLETVFDPANDLELDRDRGAAANITKAMRLLRDYSLSIREGGEQEYDLNNAIIALVREKERRTLNEL